MRIIRGYPNYKVDEYGNIYNKCGKCLKPNKNQKGYLRVYLYDNKYKRKGFAIHKLVANAFIPNPNNLPQVNHKDGNKENNDIANLEWCTGSENVKHAIAIGHHYIPHGKDENSTYHKLTQGQVDFIRKHYRFRDKNFNSKKLGEMFGVNKGTIMLVVNNKTWKEKNYACDT